MKVLTRSKHGMITGTLRGFADYYDIELNRLQLLFIGYLHSEVGVAN